MSGTFGALVEQMIGEYGTPLVLRKPVKGQYDPSTQTRSEADPINVEFVGFMNPVRVESSDGSVLYGDILIRVSPADFCDVTPTPGMFVVDGDTSYAITRVQQHKIGTEVVEWVLTVRGAK